MGLDISFGDLLAKHFEENKISYTRDYMARLDDEDANTVYHASVFETDDYVIVAADDLNVKLVVVHKKSDEEWKPYEMRSLDEAIQMISSHN